MYYYVKFLCVCFTYFTVSKAAWRPVAIAVVTFYASTSTSNVVHVHRSVSFLSLLIRAWNSYLQRCLGRNLSPQCRQTRLAESEADFSHSSNRCNDSLKEAETSDITIIFGVGRVNKIVGERRHRATEFMLNMGHLWTKIHRDKLPAI